MNKFIETDLHNGKHYTWCGVMNVIADLENNKLTEFNFGDSVPYSILRDILKERSWNEEDFMDTNGWELDFWITWKSPTDKLYEVSGSFILGGLKIKQLKDETN
jgi:hypothetical protein